MSEALNSYKKEIALEFAEGNQFAADAIDYAIAQDKIIITGDPFSDIRRIGKHYSQIIQEYQDHVTAKTLVEVADFAPSALE